MATVLLMAVAGTMAWMQDRYLVAPNQSDSLPGKLYLIDLQDRSGFAPGDAVAFRYSNNRWGYPADATWLKHVRGLPGERIDLAGQQIIVGGRYGGHLSTTAMKRGGLSPVNEREVPTAHLYVAGEHPASLDSRYAEFGFVPFDSILGKAARLW